MQKKRRGVFRRDVFFSIGCVFPVIASRLAHEAIRHSRLCERSEAIRTLRFLYFSRLATLL